MIGVIGGKGGGGGKGDAGGGGDTSSDVTRGWGCG